jgi:hypothetical protein
LRSGEFLPAFVRPEGILDYLYLRFAVFVPHDDSDHVETAVNAFDAFFLKIPPGGVAELPLLARDDGLLRQAEVDRGPRPHLNENEALAVARDYVYLPGGRPKIALYDLVSFLFERARGAPLSFDTTLDIRWRQGVIPFEEERP